MSVEIASLRIEVDATPAKAAKVALDDLTKSGAALESVAGRVNKAQREVGAGHGYAGTAAANAEKSIRALAGVYGQARDVLGRYAQEDGRFRLNQEATTLLLLQNAKATEALTREQTRAAKQVEALTRAYDPLQAEILKTTRQIEEAVTAQGAQGAAAEGLRGKLANLQRAHAGAGDAAKLQSYQLLNLGRQGADVFVSLASGQAIWMVAIQQGAQIGEVFAEAATQGVTFRAALAGIAEAAGPVVALLGPIVLIGGAVAAAAVAFNQGDKEAAKLANTLALAGSNAGISAVQFEQFARQVGGETKAGTDEARKALLGLTETGKFSGDTIRVLGQDVVQFARLTGKSTQESVAYFAQMGSGVADFAVKFQQSYGGITLAQIEHIQLLERQGATTQAQLEASIMIHDRLGKAGPVNLGYLEKAWFGVATAVKEAWTWLKMWGNEAAGRANAIQNIQDQIRLNNQRLQGNPASGKGNTFLDDERRQLEARNKGLQGQLTALRAVEAAEQKRVQAEATANQVQADGIAAADEHANSWAKIAKNVGLATQEIERYRKGQADIRAANPNSKELDSPAQAAAIEAAIRKRYEHLKDGPSAASLANRAVRAEGRGDNAIEQAKAAELAAQLATTRDVEAIAGIKRAQIAQELKGQEVRLLGQVKAKEVSQADADAALAHYRGAAAAKVRALSLETANQVLERDLAQQQAISQYTDRTQSIRAAMAGTLEEANGIERKALLARQADEVRALEARTLIKSATDDRALAEGIALRQAQIGLHTAEQEQQAREQRLRIFQRDLDLARQSSQNELDLLGSRKSLAQSAHGAAQFDRQIAAKRYSAERDELQRILDNKDADERDLAYARARLPVVAEIYANELRALDLSDNMVTAYSNLVQALAGAAQSVIDGDFGGSISGAAGVAQQLAGLTSGKLSSSLAGFASVAGPIGAAVSAVTGVLGAIGQKSAEAAQRKLDALNKGVEGLRADNRSSSGSIAGALEEANRAWNQDLEYSGAMVSSLRSIDNQIGSLANALGRSIRTGDLLSTAGLGLGSTSSRGTGLFGLANLFLGGSKTKTELLDQGLAFDPASYASIAAGGLSGSTYADLVTTKTKKFMGVTTGVKVSNSTFTGAIDDDLTGRISAIIQALGDGVLSSASVFGVEAAKAAEAALGSAVVDLGKLSLKDLKSDEIAEVLNATFDKVADQLAAAGVPGLEELASVGEGAFETLTRLAREYQVVDVALTSIGMSFKTVGLESVAARDGLVQLLGGVDEFTSKTSFFAQNFLTDAERLAPITKAVNDNLAQFGLSATSTRDEFKNLVLGLDVSTEAGAKAYATLLAIAPAFDKVATSAEAATKASEDLEAQRIREESAAWAEQQRINAYLTDQQTKALEQQATALQSMMSALGDAYKQTEALSKSLREFADSLAFGDLSGASLDSRYDAAKQALMSARGDQIQPAAQAFLALSQERSSSSLDYSRDVALARSMAYGGSKAADAHLQNLAAMGPIVQAMFSGNQAEVYRLMGVPGYANGGSFTIGGNPGVDQNVMSINGAPVARVAMGETVTVTPPGRASNDNSENAALRSEVARLAGLLEQVVKNTSSMERTLTNVTHGGEAMQTQAAG